MSCYIIFINSIISDYINNFNMVFNVGLNVVIFNNFKGVNSNVLNVDLKVFEVNVY